MNAVWLILVCVPWSVLTLGCWALLRRRRNTPLRVDAMRALIERPVIINGEERQPQMRRIA